MSVSVPLLERSEAQETKKLYSLSWTIWKGIKHKQKDNAGGTWRVMSWIYRNINNLQFSYKNTWGRFVSLWLHSWMQVCKIQAPPGESLYKPGVYTLEALKLDAYELDAVVSNSMQKMWICSSKRGATQEGHLVGITIERGNSDKHKASRDSTRGTRLTQQGKPPLHEEIKAHRKIATTPSRFAQKNARSRSDEKGICIEIVENVHKEIYTNRDDCCRPQEKFGRPWFWS